MEIASRLAIVAGAIIVFSGGAAAQNVDTGKAEYLSSCAACHGIDGKGNGPVTKVLKKSPADLTILAKKNNGVFPLNALYEIVDGRQSIDGHGTREMPIWGYRFTPPDRLNLKLGDDYIFLPPGSAEPVIHARILAILDYLNRIQEK